MRLLSSALFRVPWCFGPGTPEAESDHVVNKLEKSSICVDSGKENGVGTEQEAYLQSAGSGLALEGADSPGVICRVEEAPLEASGPQQR